MLYNTTYFTGWPTTEKQETIPASWWGGFLFTIGNHGEQTRRSVGRHWIRILVGDVAHRRIQLVPYNGEGGGSSHQDAQCKETLHLSEYHRVGPIEPSPRSEGPMPYVANAG